jgi:Holliday junction resolvasome RuvABC endonuclease subunit
VSDVLDQLKADLEDAAKTAVSGLSDAEKQQLADAITRGTEHLAAGRTSAAAVEALTVETLLWTNANERAKAARTRATAAISKAIINGAIAAL